MTDDLSMEEWEQALTAAASADLMGLSSLFEDDETTFAAEDASESVDPADWFTDDDEAQVAGETVGGVFAP